MKKFSISSFFEKNNYFALNFIIKKQNNIQNINFSFSYVFLFLILFVYVQIISLLFYIVNILNKKLTIFLFFLSI